MKLRIISGELGRRYINVSSSISNFRPTLERVREAISNSLGTKIIGAKVADLCSGSGAYGFEMISRGADTVIFVEKNKSVAKAIKDTIEKFNVSSKCTVFASDIKDFVKYTTNKFDIIFFDPPYDDTELLESDLIQKIRSLLSDNGVLIFEKRVNKKRKKSELKKNTKVYGSTEVEYISAPNYDFF